MPRRVVRREKKPDLGAYLYAISASGEFIKFGFATKPAKRIGDLQVGSPFELRLIGALKVDQQPIAVEIEKLIHMAVARYHERGEWFKSCPKTIAVARAMRLGIMPFRALIQELIASEVHYAYKSHESGIRSTNTVFS